MPVGVGGLLTQRLADRAPGLRGLLVQQLAGAVRVPPATPPRTASATPARVRCLLRTAPVNQTHLNDRATAGIA